MRKRVFLSLIAIFCVILLQAQTSKVNVTIDGPGVVDEYLSLNSDGTKQLKLKAVPSKFLGDVTFDGWSGDAAGTSEELIVSPDKAQDIHATFTYHRPTKKYPLVNLKQSWAQMGKPMYYEMPGLTESEAVGLSLWRGHSYLPVDYNRDGNLDYIQFPMRGGMGTDNHRENVRFWLGKPDGSFEEDPLNDNRLLGTVYSIHIKYADLNDDGYPDFCSFSTGYDREGSTLDYPVILMSSPDGTYTDLRFPDYVACFHGGEVGDIDNDGDMDVVFISIYGANYNDCLLLINDGKGNFTEKNFAEILDVSELNKRFSKPFHGVCHGDLNIIDLNNDGYNDLAFTGSDVWDDDGSNYATAPMVLWGNSSGIYGGTNYSLLPRCRLGYSICEDLAFYDINGDGVKEIIAERNGDGQFGGTHIYKAGYLQVCELENGQYVDKTEEYIPVENTAYNETKSETALWIENIDGTDYVFASFDDQSHLYGVGVGPSPIYAIRNGKLEPTEGYTKTKVPSYDEGMPIYVDGPVLTDFRFCNDGVNPVDTMAEHRWGIAEGDEYWADAYSGGSGNMWRINLAHRKDTHFGRTCIRWNRDGLDPNKKFEGQEISFGFVSDIDIQKLADEGYYLEFYIKNSDQNLTLNLSFETYTVGIDDSNMGLYLEMSNRHVEDGSFNGEWQRVLIPLSAFNGNGSFSMFRDFIIRAGKGDLNNEFYLDDIRIRRLADSGIDDYERAFLMDYVRSNYYTKDRTAQVQSQEFKAMLKSLIRKFAPDSISYFNRYITDYEVPLTRGMATCMAYYTARCIGAETNNSAFGEFPADLWDGEINDNLLPHWLDPGEEDAPENMPWRSTGYGGVQTCWWWNVCHQSDHSGINVIALDKEANSYHWDDPLTWEDAICAITRLYDSIDHEAYVMKEISIGSKGKTTMTSSKALDFSGFDDLKAYVATGYESNGTVWLTRVKQVPANTPIMIKGEADKTYDVPVLDKCVAHYENMFKGSADEDLTISNTTSDGKYKNFYMASGQFKPASDKGQSIKAGKCYLQVPASFKKAVSGTSPTVKIADSGKSSYAPPVDVDLTDVEGLKAYAATGYDAASQTIWLTRINKIQAGEGVMLKGEANKEYTLPAAEVQAYYGNMFVGNTDEKITINETSDDGEWANFYLASGQFKKVSGTREIGTNKSYLHLPTSLLVSSSNARGKSNDFAEEWSMEELETEFMLLGSIEGEDDGTTKIDAIRQGDAQPDVYYNLQGQHVENPRKGLYIKNGIKVVIK